MKKLLHNNSITYVNSSGILPVSKGGTGHDSSMALINELDALPLGSKNEPLGAVGLDNSNTIPTSLLTLPNANPSKTIIEGVVDPQAKKTTLYTIVNYSALDTYTISATRGTVSRSGNTITYVGPLTEGPDVIIVNGQSYPLAVRPPVMVVKPSITYPANGASTTVTVQYSSSAFTTINGMDTHASTQWQLSTNSAFTNIVKDITGTVAWDGYTGDGTWLNRWNISGLTRGVTYYARIRYKGAEADYSPWSDTVGILVVLLVNPVVTYPPNGSGGHGTQVTFYSSGFATQLGNDSHYASHWELATDANFANVVAGTYNDTVNKTSVTFNTPNRGWGYYIRVAHIGVLGGSTIWSPNGYVIITQNMFPWTPTHVGVEDTGKRAFTLYGVYSGVLSSADATTQRDQMNANGYAYTEFQAEWTDGYVEGRNSVGGLIAGNYAGVRVYSTTAWNGFGYPPSNRSVRFRCRAHTHDGRVSQWSAWGVWIGAG